MNDYPINHEHLRRATRSTLRYCWTPAGFKAACHDPDPDAISTLVFIRESDGRSFVPWYPDLFATYPVALIRLRPQTLGELQAAFLLRNTGRLHLNLEVVDPNETLTIAAPRPKLP